MKYLIIIVLFLIVSCGTTTTKYSRDDTNYIMVSAGGAGLLGSIFTGDIDYCKGTITGTAIDWTITMEDRECTISGTSNGTLVDVESE